MMKKLVILLSLLSVSAALMTGCGEKAAKHTGEAQGYGGPLKVEVEMKGEDVVSVKITSHSETEGVGTRAIDALPDMIVKADSPDVESVSGATVTSRAIKEAVSQAMGVSGAETPVTTENPARQEYAPAAHLGMGMAATGRSGPGTNEDGSPVYSFNAVFACGSFDEEGRILDLEVDQLEVLSSQLTFPGPEEDADAFMDQVAAWQSKRMKGDSYMLGSGSWRSQMDAYEEMMKGKTVDEVEAWFASSFDRETGKPLTGDAAGKDAISDATMSLRDEHGDIITAIRRAWESARERISVPENQQERMVDTNTDMPVTQGESAAG